MLKGENENRCRNKAAEAVSEARACLRVRVRVSKMFTWLNPC